MPVSIGDTIPNGTPLGATVLDANTLADRGKVVGFLYKASDGQLYSQFVPDGASLPLGLGAKGLGVDASNAMYGPIQQFNGMLPPGTSVDRLIPNRQPLVGGETMA
jgi:hypothetical protein